MSSFLAGTSIGKRNARTVDSTSSVTIREDTKVQIHVDVEEASSAVKEVTDGQYAICILQFLCLQIIKLQKKNEFQRLSSGLSTIGMLSRSISNIIPPDPRCFFSHCPFCASICLFVFLVTKEKPFVKHASLCFFSN